MHEDVKGECDWCGGPIDSPYDYVCADCRRSSQNV